MSKAKSKNNNGKGPHQSAKGGKVDCAQRELKQAESFQTAKSGRINSAQKALKRAKSFQTAKSGRINSAQKELKQAKLFQNANDGGVNYVQKELRHKSGHLPNNQDEFVCLNCGRYFDTPLIQFENHSFCEGGYYEVLICCPHCCAPDMFRKAE